MTKFAVISLYAVKFSETVAAQRMFGCIFFVNTRHVRTITLIQLVSRQSSLFFAKPLETVEFLTLLRKAPSLTWQKAGPEAALFFLFGPFVSVVIINLVGIVILFGFSLNCNFTKKPTEDY